MSIDNGMMKLLAKLGLLLMITASAQAASFDCAKASTKVEHIICDNPEISKLDDELAASYKAALENENLADTIRKSQKRWMKDRNGCSDAECVKGAYKTRLSSLLSKAEENSKNHDAFKGEYILMRAWPGENVCKSFKDNLNEFRKLDFDECNPRLSKKFPEFSRPYEWKEIPFDMALAEKAIRSTTEYDSHGASASGLEYEKKLAEDRWLQWKKGSEPFRKTGQAHMWIAKFDFDGDGIQDTILRMTPQGGRARIDTQRVSIWTCDYNIGELYVIDSGNPPMAAAFNKIAWSDSDIIHFAGDGHFYLLNWDMGPASNSGWFKQSVPSVGGTRGVIITDLYRGKSDWKSSYTSNTPAKVCLIDWVPTGHYMPAKESK